MNGTPGPIDPVTVITGLLAAGGVGATVAYGIASYAVIILAAAVGAGWALGRQEPDSKANPSLFVMLVAATAALITAGLAEVANHYLGWASINWLLAPIALAIGGVGHDWPAVVKWAAGPIMRRLFPQEHQQ